MNIFCLPQYSLIREMAILIYIIFFQSSNSSPNSQFLDEKYSLAHNVKQFENIDVFRHGVQRNYICSNFERRKKDNEIEI